MAGARVEYKASVAGDLDRLDPSAARRVLTKIEKALASGGGAGERERERERLSGEFAGLFELRVGDDRVVYAKTTDGFLVLRIGHRGDVHRKGRP